VSAERFAGTATTAARQLGEPQGRDQRRRNHLERGLASSER